MNIFIIYIIQNLELGFRQKYSTCHALILIWGDNFTPCCFSLTNSKMVTVETLVFSIIQQPFIRDIHAKFGIPITPQSLDIGQN